MSALIRRKTMKIDFTKDDYRVLMEAVYLAGWIVNSSKLHEEKNPEFLNLSSKIFSFAQKFGFGELVERDDRTGEFHGNATFEDSVEQKGYISDYDEQTFWEELVAGLADKYLAEVLGEEKFRSFSREQRFNIKMSMEAEVEEVLDREGLHAVFLKDFDPKEADLIGWR